MSVKVHEAFSLDSFQDRLLWFDDFHGDQLQDEWTTTIDGGGAIDVIDAQVGGIVRLTTDNGADDDCALDWGNKRSLLVTKKATLEVRAKLDNTANISTQLALQFDTSNRIMFLSSGANWNIRCTDGGATTDENSGIALDTDYHIFRIECFPTGQVHFYIDGVECANSPITTDIPDDAGDFLQPRFFHRTTTMAVRILDIDYVYVRQSR